MHDLAGWYRRGCGYNVWSKGNEHITPLQKFLFVTSTWNCVFCFSDSYNFIYVFFMLHLQHFNLKLSQFGPYRVDYSKTGRSVFKLWWVQRFQSDQWSTVYWKLLDPNCVFSSLQSPRARWEARPCGLYWLAVQRAHVWNKCDGKCSWCEVSFSALNSSTESQQYIQ